MLMEIHSKLWSGDIGVDQPTQQATSTAVMIVSQKAATIVVNQC